MQNCGQSNLIIEEGTERAEVKRLCWSHFSCILCIGCCVSMAVYPLLWINMVGSFLRSTIYIILDCTAPLAAKSCDGVDLFWQLTSCTVLWSVHGTFIRCSVQYRDWHTVKYMSGSCSLETVCHLVLQLKKVNGICKVQLCTAGLLPWQYTQEYLFSLIVDVAISIPLHALMIHLLRLCELMHPTIIHWKTIKSDTQYCNS